jgi:hypothetical protein
LHCLCPLAAVQLRLLVLLGLVRLYAVQRLLLPLLLHQRPQHRPWHHTGPSARVCQQLFCRPPSERILGSSSAFGISDINRSFQYSAIRAVFQI